MSLLKDVHFVFLPQTSAMLDKIKEHLQDIENAIATDAKELEVFRVKYLGSKGLLKGFFNDFKSYRVF